MQQVQETRKVAYKQKYRPMWSSKGDVLYNGVELNLVAALSLTSLQLPNPIGVTESGSIIYPCGQNIIALDIDKTFVGFPRQKQGQVTCFNHSSEKAITMIGVAPKDSSVTLELQWPGNSALLPHPHYEQEDRIIYAEAICEGFRSWLGVTLSSQGHLSLWVPELKKLLGFKKVPEGTFKIVAHPTDAFFLLLGRNYAAEWKSSVNEPCLEEAHVLEQEGNGCVDAAYVQAGFIIARKPNIVQLYKNGRKVSSILVDIPNIRTLAYHNYKILIAGDANYLEEFTIDKENLIKFKKYELLNRQIKICYIASCPDFLAISLELAGQQELWYLKGENIEPLLTQWGHQQCIRSQCPSVARNMLISSSDDKTIRVWRNSKHWECCVVESTTEVAKSVSVHPAGIQIAVALEQEVRIYFILRNSLSMALNAPKRCESVAYSLSGEWLAIGNNTMIEIYCAYTFNILHSLTGCSSLVVDLRWVDVKLTASCVQGQVHVWSFDQTPTKILDLTRRDLLIKSAIYDPISEFLVTINHDGVLQVLSDNATVVWYEGSDFKALSMDLNTQHRILAIGLANGSVRIMLWPIVVVTDSSAQVIQEAEWMDVPIHSSGITSVVFSEPYNMLFAGNEEGVILGLSTKYIRKGREVVADNTNQLMEQLKLRGFQQNSGHVSLNELSLVAGTDIDNLAEDHATLEESVKNLENDRFEIEKKEKAIDNELHALDEEFRVLIDKARRQKQTISEQILEEANEFEQKMQNLAEMHDQKLITREEENNKKLNEQFEKYDKLRGGIEEMREKFTRELESVVKAHGDTIEAVQKDYQTRIERVESAHEELKMSLRQESEKYEAMVSQTEVDYESLVNDEKKTQQNEVFIEQQTGKECMAAHAKLLRENMSLQKECQELSEKASELRESNKTLHKEKQTIADRLDDLEREMEKREDHIKKKEQTIKELRSLHIHLQNFRFVLDQKIKTLKDEKVPMEEQITHLQEHMGSLFAELLDEEGRKRDLNKQYVTLRRRHVQMLENSHKLREDVLKSRNSLEQLQNDIGGLLDVHEKDELILRLKDVYLRHVGKDDLEGLEPEIKDIKDLFMAERKNNSTQVKNEVELQNERLSEMLQIMEDQKKSAESNKQHELLNQQQENQRLMKECYDLRSDRKHLMKIQSTCEAKIKQLKFALKGGVPLPLPQREPPKKVKPTPFQEHKMKAREASKMRRPDFRIRTLIGEIEKNRYEIQEENARVRQIHDKVSRMLSEDYHTPSTNFMSLSTLPQHLQGESSNVKDQEPLQDFFLYCRRHNMDLQTKIQKFIGTAASRDKVARILQYLFRAIYGSLKDGNYNAFAEKVWTFSKALSLFRATLRFGVPINVALTIAARHYNQSPPPTSYITTIKDICGALYFLTDHILYFEKIGLSQYGMNSPYMTFMNKLSNWFWLLESIFGILNNIIELGKLKMNLQKMRERNWNDEHSEKHAEYQRLINRNHMVLLDLLRCIVDLPICVHFIDGSKFGPVSVGIFGTVTSAIGIYNTWRSISQ